MSELTAHEYRTLDAEDAIANNSVVPYYLRDRKLRISIARVDNKLYTFDDLCSCAAEPCPLSSGLLTGPVIVCQCHGSRFDITTGAVIAGPATDPLTMYEVRASGGSVQVRA